MSQQRKWKKWGNKMEDTRKWLNYKQNNVFKMSMTIESETTIQNHFARTRFAIQKQSLNYKCLCIK